MGYSGFNSDDSKKLDDISDTLKLILKKLDEAENLKPEITAKDLLNYYCIHQAPFAGGILLKESINKTPDECFFCDDEEYKR